MPQTDTPKGRMAGNVRVIGASEPKDVSIFYKLPNYAKTYNLEILASDRPEHYEIDLPFGHWQVWAECGPLKTNTSTVRIEKENPIQLDFNL